jgi:hypothetical protein
MTTQGTSKPLHISGCDLLALLTFHYRLHRANGQRGGTSSAIAQPVLGIDNIFPSVTTVDQRRASLDCC